jgi:hypothetical protein
MKNKAADSAREVNSFSSRRSARASSNSETVSFRFGGHALGCLRERAQLHDLSVHQYARNLVLEALQRNETETRMAERLEVMTAEITGLRSDSAFGVKAILMAAAKMPEDVAETWVRKNFKL